jgi:hypothetical protein
MTALSLSMGDVSATVRQAAIESLMALARKRKNSEHQFPPFVLQQLLVCSFSLAFPNIPSLPGQ